MPYLPILFTFFFTLFFSGNVQAYCPQGNVSYWPKSAQISRTPLIVITAYLEGKYVVERLTHDFPVYLVSGRSKIKLLLKENCEGENRLFQTVLVPEKLLRAGRAYHLQVENLRKDSPSYRYFFTEEDGKPLIKWKVAKAVDTIAPRWQTFPSALPHVHLKAGCGRVEQVAFKGEIADESPVLVRATVTDTIRNYSLSYYLTPEHARILVGSGMCAGAFRLQEKRQYQVVFDLVDASGNIQPWSGDPIPFSLPAH